MGLKAIGPRSAWILVCELFAWRQIKNGKQLGALVGLTPTPYDSGKSEREQGISKAGNKHVRALIVELALARKLLIASWPFVEHGEGPSTWAPVRWRARPKSRSTLRPAEGSGGGVFRLRRLGR